MFFKYFLAGMDLGQMAMLLVAFVVVVAIWHLFSKIIPAYQETMEKREMKRMSMEEHRIEVEERRTNNQEQHNMALQKTVEDQHQLLVQNTEVVNGLTKTLESIDKAFQKISTSVAVNDAIINKSHDVLMGIKENMPDRQELIRIHDRLDSFSEKTPTVDDIEIIRQSLDSINEQIGHVMNLLGEIKAKTEAKA